MRRSFSGKGEKLDEASPVVPKSLEGTRGSASNKTVHPGRAGEAEAVEAARRARNRRWSAPAVLATLLFGALAFLVVCGPLLAPYAPAATDPASALEGPSASHPLGNDHLGRDVLSRMLFGARLSVGFTAGAVAASAVVGVSLGMVAARVGGVFSGLVNRTVDTFIALPSILVGLILAAILSPGIPALLAAVFLTAWMPFSRLSYALTTKISGREYVEAAVAIGATEKEIMARHILPSAAGPLVALACLQFAYVLLAIAGLSFLGLGAQPPTAEWGAMLADARPYMERQPLLVLVPAGAIVLTTLSVTALGRALGRRWTLPPV